MTEFRIDQEFEADPDTFWRLFTDGTYHDEWYRAVGVRRQELSREDRPQEGTLVVVARYGSERQLPSFVRALLGGRELGYVETTTFDRARRRVEQRVEPTVFADRVRFGGTITIEAIAPGRVRRAYAGSIAVDAPLVGRKIEQSTVKEMERTHAEAAKVTRAWLARG
jgi:hypothetical protein